MSNAIVPTKMSIHPKHPLALFFAIVVLLFWSFCFILILEKGRECGETGRLESEERFQAGSVFQFFFAQIEGSWWHQLFVFVEKLIPREFEIGWGDEDGA